jgi:hypothetical protein
VTLTLCVMATSGVFFASNLALQPSQGGTRPANDLRAGLLAGVFAIAIFSLLGTMGLPLPALWASISAPIALGTGFIRM